MEYNYSMASASLAHTYGNVTCFMTEWLKGLFPKNYFNTVHVSSTIAYRNFSRFNNTNKEFLKKSKPIMIIKPRIEIDNDDAYMNGTYFTTRILDLVDSGDFGNLQDFINNQVNGSNVKFLMNRLTILFDVTLVVETQMAQINLVHYFKNRVRQNRPFLLKTSLESYIPRDIIYLLSNDLKMPLRDEDNRVKKFLDYLNSNSAYPVTYKYKNSAGKDEFFRYHPADIDTTISGLSMDGGSKKGVVDDMYTINFTLNCEFSTAGLYYYFTKDRELIEGLETMKLQNNEDDEMSKAHIEPIFTVSNMYDIPIDEGWSLYTSVMFSVNPHKIPDELDFSPILNTSMDEVIKYNIESGIPMDTTLKLYVMKDNKMMEENKEYKVEWAKMKLLTYNCNPASTYRIIIHVNTLLINETIKSILDLNNEK